MKRLLLLLILIFTQPTFAEDWKPMHKQTVNGALLTVDIDKNSVKLNQTNFQGEKEIEFTMRYELKGKALTYKGETTYAAVCATKIPRNISSFVATYHTDPTKQAPIKNRKEINFQSLYDLKKLVTVLCNKRK